MIDVYAFTYLQNKNKILMKIYHVKYGGCSFKIGRAMAISGFYLFYHHHHGCYHNPIGII